jgi:hypothetical protein
MPSLWADGFIPESTTVGREPRLRTVPASLNQSSSSSISRVAPTHDQGLNAETIFIASELSSGGYGVQSLTAPAQANVRPNLSPSRRAGRGNPIAAANRSNC